MMRITCKLGSWGMVILLLTRAPDGTSCWINTCLTKECRRQWRPTADPHVLLLLLLLLWQPPPPSMAGGCLSPTWTCDWSLHVLIRCSNHRTQIEIAREREREIESEISIERGRESVWERESARVCVCVKVTNEESYFRCKFAILPRTAETSHKRVKKKLRPLQKRKPQSSTANQKSQTFFVICPLVFEAKKTQLRFVFSVWSPRVCFFNFVILKILHKFPPQKKTAKLVNFTLEKITYFQKISQLLVENLTKFAPKNHWCACLFMHVVFCSAFGVWQWAFCFSKHPPFFVLFSPWYPLNVMLKQNLRKILHMVKPDRGCKVYTKLGLHKVKLSLDPILENSTPTYILSSLGNEVLLPPCKFNNRDQSKFPFVVMGLPWILVLLRLGFWNAPPTGQPQLVKVFGHH